MKPELKEWSVPIRRTVEMTGYVFVEAETAEEAVIAAGNSSNWTDEEMYGSTTLDWKVTGDAEINE